MQEITTTGSNIPSTHVNRDEVLRSDILVPYLTLGQAMSEFVKTRQGQAGDIVRSTSFEKLGDLETPVEAIFLHYPKMDWVNEKKPMGGGRFQYVSATPRTAANESLPWSYFADADGNEVPEGTKGAFEWRRQKRLSVFAILPHDIEAARVEMEKLNSGELPDPSKALTPVMISFRSSSYKAGKEICTFFTQAASMKIPIWRYSLPLSCTLEQNDEGSFYVWKVDRTKAKKVSNEDLIQVEAWAGIVNSGANLKTETEDLSETTPF